MQQDLNGGKAKVYEIPKPQPQNWRDKPKNRAYAFKRAWTFPAHVEQSLRELVEPPCLHVCCGRSELGDERVDYFNPTTRTINADMFHLPFTDGSFQSVLIDPPWHLANHLRPTLLWELRRVLRIEGLLILNCFWIPKIPGMKLNRVGLMIPKAFWRNASALAFYRKEQTTLDIDGLEIGLGSRRGGTSKVKPFEVEIETLPGLDG